MKKSLKLLSLAILAGSAFTTSSCTKRQTCKQVAADGTGLWTWKACGDKTPSRLRRMIALQQQTQYLAALVNAPYNTPFN